MTYILPFEQHQEEQKASAKADKPNIPWYSDVFCKVSALPRQPLESPLKRWWLEKNPQFDISIPRHHVKISVEDEDSFSKL